MNIKSYLEEGDFITAKVSKKVGNKLITDIVRGIVSTLYADESCFVVKVRNDWWDVGAGEGDLTIINIVKLKKHEQKKEEKILQS